MTHISNSMYTEYTMKLLSFAIVAEYRDYEDAKGDRKKKIYTCYKKQKGKVRNNLLVLIEYVLRFFSEHNMFLN